MFSLWHNIFVYSLKTIGGFWIAVEILRGADPLGMALEGGSYHGF
jgi:hypothetical protein